MSNIAATYYQHCALFGDVKVMPDVEVACLLPLAARGDHHAREQLILGFSKMIVRLAVYAALNYSRNLSDVDDLIQEGNIALLIAIERYDATKGVPFKDFAPVCIYRRLSRYCQNNCPSSIHVPEEIQNQYHLVYRARQMYYQEHGEFPSLADLSKFTGLPEGQVNDIITATPTIYGPCNIEDRWNLSCGDLESNYMRMELVSVVLAVVDELPDINRQVFYYCYGIKGYPKLDFRQISIQLNLDYDMVRRISRYNSRSLHIDPRIRAYFDMDISSIEEKSNHLY